MPSYPTFDRNPLDLADDAAAAGHAGRATTSSSELKAGRLRFAGEDPDAPENCPRVLTVWRANLLGSSGKGNEYFLKHLLGTDDVGARQRGAARRAPAGRAWRDEAPEGKLDLLLTLDFRMTSTTLFSDVVLPAATWYEKHDLNTTDMHPFVHSFNPAIAPPWQTRTDFDAFTTHRREVQRARRPRTWACARTWSPSPLLHDTPDAMATPHGVSRDWKAGECEPVPGVTMPKLVVVERDYGAVADKMAALGPLLDTLGATTKGVTFDLDHGGRVPAAQERHGPRRRRRRPARRSTRRPRVRGDPGAVRHHQRAPRHAGLPDAREAHRRTSWPTSPPSTRASRSPSPTPRPGRCR